MSECGIHSQTEGPRKAPFSASTIMPAWSRSLLVITYVRLFEMENGIAVESPTAKEGLN
jgi:hypothetical protein